MNRLHTLLLNLTLAFPVTAQDPPKPPAEPVAAPAKAQAFLQLVGAVKDEGGVWKDIKPGDPVLPGTMLKVRADAEAASFIAEIMAVDPTTKLPTLRMAQQEMTPGALLTVIPQGGELVITANAGGKFGRLTINGRGSAAVVPPPVAGGQQPTAPGSVPTRPIPPANPPVSATGLLNITVLYDSQAGNESVKVMQSASVVGWISQGRHIARNFDLNNQQHQTYLTERRIDQVWNAAGKPMPCLIIQDGKGVVKLAQALPGTDQEVIALLKRAAGQ